MRYNQLDIFNQDEGKRLADAGLSLAVETANREHTGWSDRCWNLFYQWLNNKPRYFEFMIEDFREYLSIYGLLEMPKSNRAFGFISKRALKHELIEFGKITNVKNPKAHCARATTWRKK